jgi:hypothetical protein
VISCDDDPMASRRTYSIVVKPINRSLFVRWVDAESETAARDVIERAWGKGSIESICELPPKR